MVPREKFIITPNPPSQDSKKKAYLCCIGFNNLDQKDKKNHAQLGPHSGKPSISNPSPSFNFFPTPNPIFRKVCANTTFQAQ
jgi:hypothetical protein